MAPQSVACPPQARTLICQEAVFVNLLVLRVTRLFMSSGPFECDGASEPTTDYELELEHHETTPGLLLAIRALQVLGLSDRRAAISPVTLPLPISCQYGMLGKKTETYFDTGLVNVSASSVNEA